MSLYLSFAADPIEVPQPSKLCLTLQAKYQHPIIDKPTDSQKGAA